MATGGGHLAARNPVILSKAKNRFTPVKEYFVYVMANFTGTIYTGVTNDLERRVYEHKNGLLQGFTSKYGLNKLVYFESTSDVHEAIAREKQIKGWRRRRKQALIEGINPGWRVLTEGWPDGTDSSPPAQNDI